MGYTKASQEKGFVEHLKVVEVRWTEERRRYKDTTVLTVLLINDRRNVMGEKILVMRDERPAELTASKGSIGSW